MTKAMISTIERMHEYGAWTRLSATHGHTLDKRTLLALVRRGIVVVHRDRYYLAREA